MKRDEIPQPGRLLGLDIGSRRIGVAVCDELRTVASPWGFVETGAQMTGQVRELVDRFSIVGLVAGLPAGLSGKEGPQAAEVRDVAEALGRDLGLPLVFWDERLTSKMAERMLIESGMKRQRRQQHIDSIAASLMLQSYLNRQLLKDARIKVKINSGAK